MEVRPVGVDLFHEDGRTEGGQKDMTKLIVVFAILQTRLKIKIFWDMKPCRLADKHGCFRGTSCTYYTEDGSSILFLVSVPSTKIHDVVTRTPHFFILAAV